MDLLYCGSWCHSRETPIATKMATAQATRVSKMKITKQSMSCINAFSSCRPLTVCEVRYGYRLLVQNLQPAQSDDHDFRGHEPTSKSDPYLSLTGRSFDVRQHPCLVEERLFWTVEACEPLEASVGIGGYPIELMPRRWARTEVDIGRTHHVWQRTHPEPHLPAARHPSPGMPQTASRRIWRSRRTRCACAAILSRTFEPGHGRIIAIGSVPTPCNFVFAGASNSCNR